MTVVEAVQVLETIATADSGCPVCAANLVSILKDKLPDVDWALAIGQIDDEWDRRNLAEGLAY